MLMLLHGLEQMDLCGITSNSQWTFTLLWLQGQDPSSCG